MGCGISKAWVPLVSLFSIFIEQMQKSYNFIINERNRNFLCWIVILSSLLLIFLKCRTFNLFLILKHNTNKVTVSYGIFG